MDLIADRTSTLIARRILAERSSRGWSLSDLATRSGVAKATISKIERREASPTAVVLVRIASAFDLTLASLLASAEDDRGRVVRACDQPVWQDPETGYVRKQIFRRADHPVEVVAVMLPSQARVSMPAASYARIRQVVWVQKGALSIHEGLMRHDLNAGDCLGFGTACDVTFANETSKPCNYFVALARS